MPIIVAYQCPRTLTLFTSKPAYIAYLREHARSSLRAKDLRRKVKPFMDVLPQILESARSLRCISKWLCTQGLSLAHASQQLAINTNNQTQNLEDAAVYEATVVKLDHPWVQGEYVAFDMTYTTSAQIEMAEVLNASGYFKVSDVHVLNATNGQRQCKVHLEYQHWPFLCSQALWAYAGQFRTVETNQQLLQLAPRSVMQTLLSDSFPYLSWTLFDGFAHAAVLPSTSGDFATWLFPYRYGVPVDGVAMPLPVLITD